MRNLKTLMLAMVCTLAMAALASAANPYGVADVQKIAFTGNVRIGDVLLPQGQYEVRHLMEGENHVMVFRKLGSGKPVEARVNCTLVPRTEKATRTEKVYELNAANEQVLRLIVFRGDMAEHKF